MPLQGSLETFALPDVLTLLASTAKSGELRVTGAGTDGRMWLVGGDLVASASGRAPAGDSAHADVLFELLRLEGGTFVFTEGDPESDGEPEAILPVLEEATERLDAWRTIAAVVPSMAVSTGLSAELHAPTVTLTADRWRAIVAVASARTVGDVARRLGLGEFDACRLVKELVDDGLVVVAVADPPELEPEPADEADGFGLEVDESPAPTVVDPELVAEAVEELAEAAHRPELEAEVEEDDDDPLAALSEAAARIGALPSAVTDEANEAMPEHGEELDGEFVGDGDEPINRGLLLKFLSSVRS